MNELGKKSVYYHTKVLNLVKNNKYDMHLIIGKLFYRYKKKFISKRINFYKDVNDLNKNVLKYTKINNRIFIKGSNSINLQETINLLSDNLIK